MKKAPSIIMKRALKRISKTLLEENRFMMYNKIIHNSSFFIFLCKIDQDLAKETHKKPCSYCTGKLNQTHYNRKIRGTWAVGSEYNIKIFFLLQLGWMSKESSVTFPALFWPASLFLIIDLTCLVFFRRESSKTYKASKSFVHRSSNLKQMENFLEESLPSITFVQTDEGHSS